MHSHDGSKEKKGSKQLEATNKLLSQHYTPKHNTVSLIGTREYNA
jgi:hypothetical protein